MQSPQPSIIILPLTNQHCGQVAGLILPIQRNEFKVPITLADQPDLMDLESAYFRPGGHFWGAFVDGELAGTIGLLVPVQGLKDGGAPGSSRSSSFGVIRKMFVREDFRGAPWHLAQQLLTTLIDYSRNTGMEKVYLGTISSMKAAHRFYERNGFTRLAKDELPPEFPLMAVDNVFYHLSF